MTAYSTKAQRASVWIKERDRLIKSAYRAIRRGLLALEAEALEDWLWSNFKVRVVYSQDHGGAPIARNALTDTQATRLVDSAVSRILEHYSEEGFRRSQAMKARKRWEGKTLQPEDLKPLYGMTLKEQAARLRCSISTISRLRKRLFEMMTEERRAEERRAIYKPEPWWKVWLDVLGWNPVPQNRPPADPETLRRLEALLL